MSNFSPQELSLLINAVHHYKIYSENQRQQRAKQGWDTSEQQSRIIDLDDLEEKLYAGLEKTNETSSRVN